MPDQQPSHSRRPQYRGRRGNDRRGHERRPSQHANESNTRDAVDVEQIMRDIRARIASRHGIDLSTQQIQELAARRLDAILDPRHVKPSLLEQMRRAAGEAVEVPEPAAQTSTPFAESALYESHQGLVRFLRRLFNPLLKLLFNPAPIAHALTTQEERLDAMSRREADLLTRQAEWNALHYVILQRLVTETARNAIEMQSLSLRVESLAAKLDLNERRVRAMEPAAPPAARPPSRPVTEPPAETGSPSLAAIPVNGVEGTGGDATRRRRRRRRGRRSGAGVGEGGVALESAVNDQTGDLETENDDEASQPPNGDDAAAENSALEPAHHLSLLQPAERYPSPDAQPPMERQAEPSDARELPPDVPHTPDVVAAAPPLVTPVASRVVGPPADTSPSSPEDRPASTAVESDPTDR